MTGAEILLGVAAAGIAATVAGAAVGAAGQYNQGQGQQQIANYNAQAHEADAVAVRDAAAFEEQQKREQAKRLLATQRAAFGKSGTTMEGSPLLVQADTTEQAEIEALSSRYTGLVEEARAKNRAAISRYEGAAYARAGNYAATTTLLTGASRALGQGALTKWG